MRSQEDGDRTGPNVTQLCAMESMCQCDSSKEDGDRTGSNVTRLCAMESNVPMRQFPERLGWDRA